MAASGANVPCLEDGVANSGGEEPAAARERTLGLTGFVTELVLPTLVSAGTLLVLARHSSFWAVRRPLGLGVFAVLLVALSLGLSLRLDAFTLARRRRRRQIFNRADAPSRLVKFVLAGLVIPIAALFSATRFDLPGHQTALAFALQARLFNPVAGHAEQLGLAVRHAQNPGIRVDGIVALQALGSDEALEELFRIVDEDSDALEGAAERQALSRALASYGVRAKSGLLARFRKGAPSAPGARAGDIYERYFAASFEGAVSEIEDTPDTAARAGRLARLRAAETELKQILGDAETDVSDGPAGALPTLVLQTLLRMNVTEDADLLAFAKHVAADPGCSDGIRGQGLKLISKLGGKDDLDALYAYADSSSVTLQARALEAIASLQSKLAATSKGT